MNESILIPIKTDRLLIDRFRTGDWKDYYKIEKSPEQHKHNFEKFRPRTTTQIKEFIKGLSRQNYNELQLPLLFAIRIPKNKRLIGFIGFKNGQLVEQGQVEIYYSIYKKYWNNGFGTEALKAMIDFGFKILKLHKIFAGCDIDNIASKRIMEKVGMRFESYWRQDRKRNNKWADGLGFAIIDEDAK